MQEKPAQYIKPSQYETTYIPISVRADFLYSGEITPLYYIDETGKRIEIDRINREEIRNGDKYFTCVTREEVCEPDGNEIVTRIVPTVSVI